MGAGALIEQPDLGFGAARGLALVDEEMLIGEGGDLRQVSDAENLLAARQGLELLAYGFRGAAADADVDFIEDQSARRGVFFLALDEVSSTATLSASITRLISPPEAISWRGLRGSPGLVAMRYSTSSQPEEVQCDGASRSRDSDFEASLHGQRIDLRFGQFGQLAGGGFALGAQRRGGGAICRGCLVDFSAQRL